MHLRLGRRVSPDERVPIHHRLDQRVPRRGCRRISPPDANGWREVQSRQGDGGGRTAAPRGQARDGRQLRRKKIPDVLKNRCFKCLSFAHCITTCHQPLRCLNCHGTRHMVRECKRPRSPGNGTSHDTAAPDRFVKAQNGPWSQGTLAGSEASGSTPPISPGRPQGPDPNDRDPLPLGHPEEHQWESACIVQRRTASIDMELGLHQQRFRAAEPEELQISLLRDDMSAGVQPDSDPMVLESGLHSKALLTTLHNDTRSKEATGVQQPDSDPMVLESGIHNKALLTTLLNDTRSKEAEDMAAVRAVETSSPASASRNAEAEGLATVRVVEPDSPAPAGHLQCTQVGAAEAAFDGQPEVTNLGSPGEAFLGLCSAPPAMTSPSWGYFPCAAGGPGVEDAGRSGGGAGVRQPRGRVGGFGDASCAAGCVGC
jgi:hypothetical protein